MSRRLMIVLLCVGLTTAACTSSNTTSTSTTPSRPVPTASTDPNDPIPTPPAACPPGCRHPADYDAITVLASSATLVAVVTVGPPDTSEGSEPVATYALDEILQGDPNRNVYRPTPAGLSRALTVAGAEPGRSYVVFVSFDRGGPCASALFGYDRTTRVATFVDQWSGLPPADRIRLQGRTMSVPETIGLASLRERMDPTGGVVYPSPSDESFCPGP